MMAPEAASGKHRADSDIGLIVDHIGAALLRTPGLAVMMVSLDNLDRLYAASGHARAQDAVDSFHASVQDMVQGQDRVFRFGDRKLVVVLCSFRNRGHLQLATQKIERLLQSAMDELSTEHIVRARIGIALGTDHASDAGELLRLAELAMLDGSRKDDGATFYESSAGDQLVRDWQLEQKLAAALQSGDMELHYQPKLALASNAIASAEALMRWDDPLLGPMSPELFVDVAEKSGLIAELTYFTVNRVCRQLSQWQESLGPMTVGINLSPSIVRDMEIIDVLESACAIWGVEPARLVVEVTENALIEDPEATHKVLTGIRGLGVKVSIDDFGTGYSSLAYLKEIPADELKIDRSFVMGMNNDDGNRKIVEHSVAIAHSFGLAVVAEGVEDEATMEVLRRLACEYAQGYYISRPLPPDEFLAWCKARSGPQ